MTIELLEPIQIHDENNIPIVTRKSWGSFVSYVRRQTATASSFSCPTFFIGASLIARLPRGQGTIVRFAYKAQAYQAMRDAIRRDPGMWADKYGLPLGGKRK